MENMEMQELFEKLQAAKSAEELIEMAKAEGMEITAERAEELFTALNSEGELDDALAEELAGGWSPPPKKPMTVIREKKYVF